MDMEFVLDEDARRPGTNRMRLGRRQHLRGLTAETQILEQQQQQATQLRSCRGPGLVAWSIVKTPTVHCAGLKTRVLAQRHAPE